jgi:ABC-type antimicrobial peptide transport system permease subunit
MPLGEITALGLIPQRIAAAVAGALGVVGLLLAAIGIFGVTAYAVTRRTREIGIRVALGARSWQVLRSVTAGAALNLAIGGVGLLLASIGLYGIVAYQAGRRSREIGIRVALGAQRRDVLGLIVGDGMRLVALGVATGLLLAAAGTRVMAKLLFGVSPMDAATFAAMSGVFVAVALVASWLPARRAATVDPAVALSAD